MLARKAKAWVCDRGIPRTSSLHVPTDSRAKDEQSWLFMAKFCSTTESTAAADAYILYVYVMIHPGQVLISPIEYVLGQGITSPISEERVSPLSFPASAASATHGEGSRFEARVCNGCGKRQILM